MDLSVLISSFLEIKIIRNLKDEMILAKFIDDKRFAETKIRSIRRQGGSERFIYAKLNEKGISNDRRYYW